MAPDNGDYCCECQTYHPGKGHPPQDAPRNAQGQVRMTIYVRTQTGETPLEAYRRMSR